MALEQWFFYLACIAIFSLLIPITIGMSKWKRLEYPFRILLVWLIISFSIAVLSIIISRMHKSTMYLFFLDSMNTCMCFTYFYFTLFLNKRIRTWLLFSSFIVCSLIFYNFILYFRGSTSQFSVVVEGIFNITVSVLFLAKVMISDTTRKSLFANPFFWILLAKIIPTLFSTLIAAFNDYLVLENTRLWMDAYAINYVLYFIGNIGFAIGIWKSLKFNIKQNSTIYR